MIASNSVNSFLLGNAWGWGRFGGPTVIDHVASSLGRAPWAATGLAFGDGLNIIYFLKVFIFKATEGQVNVSCVLAKILCLMLSVSAIMKGAG